MFVESLLRKLQPQKSEDVSIPLFYPPPSNRYRKDGYIFRIGNPYKPSVATVAGWGGQIQDILNRCRFIGIPWYTVSTEVVRS